MKWIARQPWQDRQPLFLIFLEELLVVLPMACFA
jgi:hypothetical protein